MQITDIDTLKNQQRRILAKLPFEAKIAILIRMQRLAREMAIASGRSFKGTVWGEEKMKVGSSRAEMSEEQGM